MQRPWNKRSTALIALALSGLLVAGSAMAGTSTSADNAKPITPVWSFDDAVQQMRDEWQGGTVMADEMTGQIREFNMYIEEIEHELTDGVRVTAWGFGLEGQPATVPGPSIRVKKGDLVKIHLNNKTDQPHSLHSHGITSLDELNDGVPHVNGNYIMPGKSFTYEFVASEAGTHWYHCHVQTSLHQDMGMYGSLIVEDTQKPTWDKEFVAMIDEWDTHRNPADAAQSPTYNYFTVNGKAGKSIPDMVIKDGEIARIRVINAGFESHALHLHGTHFVITHKDGYQVPLPQRADTLNIAPGETYDLLVKGRDGTWPWHDHNSLAVTDAGVYPGGMVMHIRGSEARRFNPNQRPVQIPLEGEIHNQSHGPADTGVLLPGGLEIGGMKAPIITPDAVKPETTLGPAVSFDPIAPAQLEQGKVVDVKLEAKRVTLEVAPGDVRAVWTFNGSVPGPTIRVHQGDTVRITLENKDPEMAHGLDFHAGQMDSGTFHQAIKPGERMTFAFKANYPGVFYYHCSAGPVIMHIANGMFGAVIVDPPGYKPEGQEYVLIQNEWYDPAGGLQELLEGRPTSTAFNGVAMQYANKPLQAKAGEKIRFYFVNAGINDFAAFHVIGEIFDRVYTDGNPKNLKKGVQTITVPPGGAVVTDLVADAGTYPILTHQMNTATQGALGILEVKDDAIPDVAARFTVLYNGQKLKAALILVDDHIHVPVDEFAALAGVSYQYDEAAATLMFAGKTLHLGSMGHGGPLYSPIRLLAEALGAEVGWDPDTMTATVTR